MKARCWLLSVLLPVLAVAQTTKQSVEIRPSQTITFKNFAANEVYPADLDGDGKLELLCLQSPGIYQSEVFNGTASEIPVEQRKIFCLTAITLKGKILWQLGKPNLKFRQPGSHVADQMVWAGLIADKTKPEVAVIRANELLILNAKTGDIKRSTKLPEDNFGVVIRFRTQRGARLLIHNTEKAYPPYEYSSPSLIYDANTLQLIVTIPDALGGGHSPRALDLDGDGNDELLIGYDAYDANGRRLWRMENLGKVHPIKNHVDQVQVGFFGTPPSGRVIYAGSANIVIGTLDGKNLFQQNFGHPQHVVLGDFRAGNKRASIAIYGCRDLLGAAQSNYLAWAGIAIPPKSNRNNIAFLNPQGEIVNVIFPPALKYHSGEGILVYPQGLPDGSDIIITRDWEWPEALNPVGEKVFAFTLPKTNAQKNPGATTGPGADGYSVRIADFDSDGRAEILIHDQTTAWIYQPPQPKKGSLNTHKRLQPVTGQGWHQWEQAN